VIGNLSRRERVLIVASVLVLGVLGILEFVVQPIREENRIAADLVPVRERTLQRRQELIARKSAISAELAQVNARIDEQSARFLAAAAPPVAASELQKIAKDSATAAGMEVRSERILPPVERGELLEIPVEIAVSGQIRNLVELLSRLEAAPKLVVVQDVKVRVMNVAQPKDLLTTVTLTGFIMPAKAKG
jgi:Tfp pilus assembly protein PilO